ncbi:MAG TPA: hypothetical protein VK866_15355 [Acidimicrobiales bacterium]|nr:hypothetical protein [Acidimicrobiales bacterium]
MNESLRDLLRSGGDPESLTRLGVTPDDLVDLHPSTPIGVDGGVVDEEITIGTIVEAAGLEEPLAHTPGHGWSADAAAGREDLLPAHGDDAPMHPASEPTEVEIVDLAWWVDDEVPVDGLPGQSDSSPEGHDETLGTTDHDPEPGN